MAWPFAAPAAPAAPACLRPPYMMDAGAIAAIDAAAFAPLAPWPVDRIRDALRAGRSFHRLASAGGRPVGFLLADASAPGRLRVARLAVLPGHRRRGIGTMLVRAMLDLATGDAAWAATASASEDWDAAHRFFRALGFRATGVIRRGMGDGRDEYAFRMDLGGGCGRRRGRPGDGRGGRPHGTPGPDETHL